MSVTPILLNYKKTFEEPSETAGTDGVSKDVTGNVILLIRDDVVNYFNIPKAAETEIAKATGGGVTTVAAFTYTRYKDLTDTTGTTVNVREHEKSRKAIGGQSPRNVIVLNTEILTPKKNPRIVSIRFPAFFNVVMLSQAIGSMLRAKQPSTFKCNGNRYPFIINVATDIVAPAKSGAWVSTTAITPVNVDDVSAVGGVTTVAGGSGAKSKGTPTP